MMGSYNNYRFSVLFPCACSLVITVCSIIFFHPASAQFLGPQTQFPNIDINQRRQLSPQQQGHILSDIQQHQHRFNLHQNVVNNPPTAQTFQPQQFLNSRVPAQQQPQQTIFNQQHLFQQQQQQPVGVLLQQQPIFNQQPHLYSQQTQHSPLTGLTAVGLINQQNSLLRNNNQQLQNVQTNAHALFNNPTLAPVQPAPIQSQNLFLQHHTQTSFTPNNKQQASLQPTLSTFNVTNANVFSPKFQAPPIPETIFNIDAQQQPLDPEKQKQRLKELREKQAIIDKHNQFVEKQYKKALEKAQSDHSNFLATQLEQKKKLYQTLYKPTGYENVRYTQQLGSSARFLYPEEAYLFKQAVESYYREHPTTTTTETPTTTTTESTDNLRKLYGKLYEEDGQISNEQLHLNSDHAKLFSQLKLATQQKNSPPTVSPTQHVKSIQSLDDLSLLQKQYKSQQINKDDLLAQLRLAIGANSNEEDVLSKNVTSREISLPNGQKVQIIRTNDPSSIPGAEKLDFDVAPTKAPKIILDELTKGVLPPGANFDLLKQGSSGLEQVQGGIPTNQGKKVTFVLLEEQSDGSFKVQGVKGNGDDSGKDLKDSQVDVDSIIKSITDGEIKLPTNVKNSVSSTSAIFSTTQRPRSTRLPSVTSTTKSALLKGISISPNSEPSSSYVNIETPVLKTNIGTQFVSTVPVRSSTYYKSTTPTFTTTTTIKPSPTSSQSIVTFDSLRLPQQNDLARQESTAGPTISHNSIFSSPTTYGGSSTPKPTTPTSYVTTYKSPVGKAMPRDAQSGRVELPEVLRSSGLFAMAKFLRQSGLDTILNETGPYTVFAPTDKAFRTLLVQLGGPEKAEEKFKENPRLLSGLLLHHVIPGAFKIGQLQDEMTGVSLAGTQLRVNQYNMHDLEWNDIKVTTINGAKMLEDKWDIAIPQGVAHGIDRVMFPLPVGDIVQTLQSDRERRFTTFLRALFASGLAQTLQGTKTFTLFAPTDRAFATLSTDDLSRTVSDRTAARHLVMVHITPTTLYTNGMRYYQIRDSLEADKQITLSKSSGRIKVNNLPLVTQNIPATNGVIHAIDSLL